LLAWSADPDLEQFWDRLEASGRLRSDGLMISAENAGGNKIDWYLRPQADVKIRRVGNSYQFDVSVTIDNQPRNPTSQQIEGTRPDQHFVMLDLHLPERAEDPVSFDQPFKAVGADPPMRAANLIYTIPLGTSRTMHFQFFLPSDVSTITVLPSARVEPLTITVNGFQLDDAIPRTILLPRAAPFEIATWWGTIGLLLIGTGMGMAGNALGARATSTAEPDGRRGRSDRLFEIGWWLALLGIAMLVVQAGLMVQAS
jgi:hypothetical protein